MRLLPEIISSPARGRGLKLAEWADQAYTELIALRARAAD